MTSTDQEVEAVARAIDPASWALYDMMPGRIYAIDVVINAQKACARVTARAAIAALDQVRGQTDPSG